ncbi:ABC transporter permease [Ohtaekwangia koreensis]|uniref:Transport permease protein n=1 Tax=Ohtaekwangia koreensis TaxID=688867 RepID=A0A1T5LMI0_9BACT|nr:ABC transporter permease [Ohtaekwangia koreensis]SKC77197.1 lipopolysaccharide transport system permease protein [Ohtaekwangia koreensis]
MNEPYTETIIEPANRLSFNFKELWSYRELFYFFTWRDIKVKYKQTVLGVFWVMLQPLFMMLIFTFFFGQRLGVKTEGIPYPVFAFSGLILWNFFSSSVTNAGNSMVLNAPIIKKIYFPRLIIPLSSVLASLVDLVVALMLFILFLFFYPVTINALELVIFWPLAFALSLIGAVGLGCWLAALMIKYRDFRFVVSFVMQVAFFLTPIVYPVSRGSLSVLEYILALNPMYAAITLFRIPMTTDVVDPILIAISICSSFLSLLLGLNYFRKTELFFADLA